MGRHALPDTPPPPAPHRPYKVIVALGAIVALAVIAMAVVAAIYPAGGGAAQAGVSSPALPGANATESPVASPPQGPANPGGIRPPVNGSLTATYSTPYVWSNRFEGQLVLRNNTQSTQAWQVSLRYPAAVTGYVINWVEGAPAARHARTGNTNTFTGAVSLLPHQSVTLHVQFDKAANTTGFAPTLCVVNGQACTVVSS